MTQPDEQQPADSIDPHALSEGHYEFDYNEPEIIRRCGARVRLWGMISMAIGGLFALGAIGVFFHGGQALTSTLKHSYLNSMTVLVGGANMLGGVVLLALCAVHLTSGWLYIGSGDRLQEVVDTEGNDIELLMRSLKNMATAFMIEVILMVVAVALSQLAWVTSL